MKDNHWDPTIPMPILFPVLQPLPNYDSNPTTAVDHPQPTSFEPHCPNLPPSHESLNLAGPMETNIGEDLDMKKLIKVHSRRGKNPAPQLS